MMDEMDHDAEPRRDSPRQAPFSREPSASTAPSSNPHEATTSPVAAALVARKPHSKTRTGCKTCKRRKIKVRSRTLAIPPTPPSPPGHLPPWLTDSPPVRRGPPGVQELPAPRHRVHIPRASARAPLGVLAHGRHGAAPARPRAPAQLHDVHVQHAHRRPGVPQPVADVAVAPGHQVRLRDALPAGRVGAAHAAAQARAEALPRARAGSPPDRESDGGRADERYQAG